MTLLQFALLFNALFSMGCGIYLVFFRNKVAHWFGKEKTRGFLILGILLIVFSISVFAQITAPKADPVFFIIVQDVVWVVASAAIILFRSWGFSKLGYQIIGGVALMVLLFAVMQATGLYTLDVNVETGKKRLIFSRVYNVSKQQAWVVIADVGNYHEVAPNIDKVTIISGQKKGMVRQCHHSTERWTEVATIWEEGEKYAFEVNTKAQDYPYPFSNLKGTWQVKKLSDFTTEVTMIFDFSYQKKWQNILVHPFLKSQFNEVCQELMENWAEQMERSKQLGKSN